MAAAAVLVVVGMAWSFILGVVVGRGHHPEQVVEDVVRQALPVLDNTTATTVLRPEELQFFEKLHRMPVGQNATPPGEGKAAPKVAATKSAAQGPNVVSREAKNQTMDPARGTAVASGPALQFLFEYQLAALESGADADTMVQRLRAARIEAQVSKVSAQGKTWYRVLVRHRGGVESALEFKEHLKKNGFTDIVLRSRQPLTSPKN